MQIELAIFDMAGTTVLDNDNVSQALIDTLAHFEINTEIRHVNPLMGIPKPDAIKMLAEFAGHPGHKDPEFIAKVHDHFEEEMVKFYETHPSVSEVEGASDVFLHLRSMGVAVALDTGFSRPIADAIIRRLGWDEGFLMATVTSDEVERGRPQPDMIYEAMRRCGCYDCKAVAKIGDTPSDLMEGHAAGCGLVIGVTQGTHTEGQLSNYPHTHLVPNIMGVPRIIRNLKVDL